MTIEASPVAAAVLAWFDDNPQGFDGVLNEMHKLLSDKRYRPEGEQWPRSARALGDALRRVTPALRALGIRVDTNGKKMDGIHWVIESQHRLMHEISRNDVHDIHHVHEKAKAARSDARHEHDEHGSERF